MKEVKESLVNKEVELKTAQNKEIENYVTNFDIDSKNKKTVELKLRIQAIESHIQELTVRWESMLK